MSEDDSKQQIIAAADANEVMLEPIRRPISKHFKSFQNRRSFVELLFLWVAIQLSHILNSKVFDIRLLGALHASLYVLAFAVFVTALRHFPPLLRSLSCLALFVVMTD